jgi:uncharacterized glyoxalase superfamily protein PhnB
MEQMVPGSIEGPGQGSCALELIVEDVDRECEHLTELGIQIVNPPTPQPWELRSVWLRDPDGNSVSFYVGVTGV